VVAVEQEGGRHAAQGHPLIVVGIGVTAFDVEQARTPGVAKAGGDRAEAALIVGVDIGAGEGGGEIALAEPGILAFGAEHPVRRELPIQTGLDAAEHAGAGIAQHRTVEVAAAAEGTADMAADIEAGPVIERRRIDGRLVVVGAGAEIGAKGGRGGGEGCDGHEGSEDLLHCAGLRKPFGDRMCGPPPWPST
jgi:hypothetical protein